jgi:hypothetical protein
MCKKGISKNHLNILTVPLNSSEPLYLALMPQGPFTVNILVFICDALTVRLELSVEAVDLIEKQGCGCSTLLECTESKT